MLFEFFKKVLKGRYGLVKVEFIKILIKDLIGIDSVFLLLFIK